MRMQELEVCLKQVLGSGRQPSPFQVGDGLLCYRDQRHDVRSIPLQDPLKWYIVPPRG
jgi:hypothetical protein